MKKLNTLILILFITININAQNDSIITIVEYQTSLKLGLPSQNISQLYFNKNQSCFIEGKYHVTNMPIDVKIKNDEKNEKKEKKYFVDLSKKQLYKEELFNNDLYLIKEKLPKIKWDLSFKETDSILGFLCNKAKGHFRGRTYSVWYTSGIPVRFGPWKLQGLPGLILKISDDLGQVEFTAISLQYKNKEEYSNIFELSSNHFKTISLEESVSLKDKEEEEELKKIMASMPRDSRVGNMKINKDRTSKIEMKYEWEQEN
ncbi:GLPGLI family protein [Psychroflexus gondwanensis]|jgi:GLPGLI family protein|uniref:GLPGLI family protein n=1 Tax=Psychroflexus gondwanensis TaxID=251 RepID=UPI0011BFD5D2|nr:GLPGLI family protein [Psychroflexus gondwanensis]TXE15788.1 GLPGLI family protein [Psychroflexus gondwanensis]